MKTVSPAVASEAAFWIVLSGMASVPGFLSLALGSLPATKICAAKALDAASTASTTAPARIARKEKCLAIVLMDRLLEQVDESGSCNADPQLFGRGGKGNGGERLVGEPAHYDRRPRRKQPSCDPPREHNARTNGDYAMDVPAASRLESLPLPLDADNSCGLQMPRHNDKNHMRRSLLWTSGSITSVPRGKAVSLEQSVRAGSHSLASSSRVSPRLSPVGPPSPADAKKENYPDGAKHLVYSLDADELKNGSSRSSTQRQTEDPGLPIATASSMAC